MLLWRVAIRPIAAVNASWFDVRCVASLPVAAVPSGHGLPPKAINLSNQVRSSAPVSGYAYIGTTHFSLHAEGDSLF